MKQTEVVFPGVPSFFDRYCVRYHVAIVKVAVQGVYREGGLAIRVAGDPHLLKLLFLACRINMIENSADLHRQGDSNIIPIGLPRLGRRIRDGDPFLDQQCLTA